MGYYTRVFCSDDVTPKVGEILDYLKKNGCNVSINPQELGENWTEFELIYDSQRLPLIVELNRKDDLDNLAENEISEFFEFIGKPNVFEFKKKKVISHLKKTKYIVCIQLPSSDIVDEGYDVNGYLMSFIENNYSGMTQADSEGFYQNNKLLLKME